jgi:protein-tyrosine phosphatase
MEGLAWLSRRQLDGGVDRVPLPDGVRGSLWLCGKHAIAPDRRKVIEEVGGTTTVVCLVERHELDGRYPEYVAWLERSDATDVVWFPIPDLHAPDVGRLSPLVDQLVRHVHEGEALVVHCGAGMGRAGTIAACVLIRLGLAPDVALQSVADARPGAGPEVGAQRELVDTFARLERADGDAD